MAHRLGNQQWRNIARLGGGDLRTVDVVCCGGGKILVRTTNAGMVGGGNAHHRCGNRDRLVGTQPAGDFGTLVRKLTRVLFDALQPKERLMIFMNMRIRAWVLGCVALLCATTSGCALVSQLQYAIHGYKTEAKFKGLEGKKVAVVCFSESSGPSN